MCIRDRGRIGYKSKDLKSRQQGNSKEVIDYADHANEYMRRKYYRLMRKGKKHNIAVSAIARDLSCFVWGLMTDNISIARDWVSTISNLFQKQRVLTYSLPFWFIFLTAVQRSCMCKVWVMSDNSMSACLTAVIHVFRQLHSWRTIDLLVTNPRITEWPKAGTNFLAASVKCCQA